VLFSPSILTILFSFGFLVSHRLSLRVHGDSGRNLPTASCVANGSWTRW
jgi:hypothetical protein